MKKTTRNIIIAVGILLALIILFDALYIVSETNQVIITQFGEPMGEAVTGPGVHVKTPFIQKANFFEKRWLEWDGEANQIPTQDKKYIWVDTYARWRISDPLLFFQRVRNQMGAQSRLDDIIDGQTRNTIATYNLIEIVRSSNREFEISEELAGIVQTTSDLPTVNKGRKEITRIILEDSRDDTKELGIELKDVKFKRINYVNEVQKKVFDRMIAERQRIASKYRSEGQGRSAEINGEMQKELQRIQSEAYRKAQEIRGNADGEATDIYASAYNRDPEFYQFMKSLETYNASLNKDTWLILSTDSEFLKYLKRTGK